MCPSLFSHRVAAWMISATSGDCGYVKRVASRLFTVAGCVMLGWQVARRLWSRWAAAHRE